MLRERDGASGESGYVMMSEVVKVANRERERGIQNKRFVSTLERESVCQKARERERELFVRSCTNFDEGG